jgi:hypothetical protein
MLEEARANALADGRNDVAEYLSLRSANDELRRIGTQWLFDTFIEIAGAASRNGPAIAIDRTDPTSFGFRGANMVGSRLRLTLGVRCLTVEAGWTRTPGDGFIRGGALAIAQIRHFGIPKANAQLALLREADTHIWSDLAFEKPSAISVEHLKRHFGTFLGG